MDVLEAILTARDGAAVREAGRSAGLSPAQATSALIALAPALAAGLQRNAAQPEGLNALRQAIGKAATSSTSTTR